MRHLRSILYALVLAPVVWILCGVGFDQDLTGRARDNGGIESLGGVLLLVLAGAAYAILLFSPISPLGPTLAGLAFAGVGAWARIAPDSYAGVWPANVAKDGFDVSTPGYGLAVLLAVPMLGTALSARRWRAFEPPEILLIGTIGQARGAARVAGTPMASERTTVIPQQRQPSPEFVPGFGPPPAHPTRFGAPGSPSDDQTIAVPVGRPRTPFDPEPEEDRTTVLRLGAPPAPAAERDEPTQLVTPPGPKPAADDRRTEQFTEVIPGADETTNDVTAPAAAGSTPAADETTREVTGEEPTRLVPATGAEPADEDDKTQLLTLPKADGRATGATDHGERTQAIRLGTVEPPGDRTQLLTFPTPGEVVTVAAPDAEESTTAMSIVAAERPDPGEDPTTRLTPPAEQPGHPGPERGAATVTSLERPADEAADDTRPLTLPAPRPPAEDETTRLV